MKYSAVVAAGLLGLGATAEQNLNKMDRLKELKTASWDKMRAAGAFAAGKYQSSTAFTPCVNGKAGEYSCDNVDLYTFLSHEDMGSTTREGNDIWGWTSPEGREFAAVGQTDGTAFVEVLKDGTLKWLARLPTQTQSSPWRDMKVINGFVYIGSEASGHGLQVFDMRKLLNITTPVTFDIKKDLTAWYNGFGSSHNIVANEATNMIYAVGTSRSSSCRGGLYMLDVSNPAKPTSPGCLSEDGYVHDAQCVIYNGPDKNFWGKEVCFGYNEDTLTIMDVSDKKKPKIISKTPYKGASYTHQGWLIDQVEMTHLLSDDELDEQDGNGVAANGHTTTYIWNIASLAKPVNTGTYQSPAQSIDHNQYVVNGKSYQSNYNSGLRIVDVSAFGQDDSGRSFHQAGFFDCHPEDDAKNVVDFGGSWSTYPFFKSGFILLNSIERGVYSLKYTGN
jgi:choice-of-anchor B domain-containing protein